jgi:transposase
MSTAIVEIGVDVAKLEIDAYVPDRKPLKLSNDPKGHTTLIRLLRRLGKPCRVTLEATGGYEMPLMMALWKVEIQVSRVNPKRVRDYARSKGWLAKTDQIDAKVLSSFGESSKPRLTEPIDGRYVELRKLMTQRDQIIEIAKTVRNQITEAAGKAAKPVQKLLKATEETIEALEKQALALVHQTPELNCKVELLRSVKSVGAISAMCLLSYLPELGSLNRQTAAALTGVAPFNYDSGQKRGQRHIQGGRCRARRHLYMCALVASRWNPVLSLYYKRLREKGKAPKVALVAVMRKLLSYLNNLLKEPNAIAA